MATDIAEILETFDFLDDWEDRYKYLIDLGKELPELTPSERTDANKVRGCVSQVWLITDIGTGPGGEPVLTFRGDSDALIVQGLVAIVTSLFSNKGAQQILDTDVEGIFAQLGLQEHLTPQRSNGLRSMVGRIRSDAQNALAAA
ncbi:MAG: SufE family protein [Pseudomonadota bacterium]